MTKKIASLETKNKECLEKLKDQQEKIFRPLLVELSAKENILQTIMKDYDENLRDLKMLNTVVRVPKLSRDFINMVRKRDD